MEIKTEQIEYNFESEFYNILPGVSDYYCKTHNKKITNSSPLFMDIGTIKDNVHIRDFFVEENRQFKYSIIKPAGAKETNKVVFVFHGFNEKDWNKYIPWANSICEGTGSSVILFPIAFHMQRVPKYWSQKREMYKLSEQRKKKFPDIEHSSLSNVAISMRLHSMPQRFIWSGLQTYYDVIRFIELCKDGKHEFINKDFDYDIFAYSIGGFLAQTLKLTNYKNYFSNTKICLFCSGATFNKFTPVSKFIIDSEANKTLSSFLVNDLGDHIQKDEMLNHYLQDEHLEGKVLKSLFKYHNMKSFREDLLKKYKHQIYALTLKKDYVIRSSEVIASLSGADIKVEELDFDRHYIHENPFPEGTNASEQIENDLQMVFKQVCDFYNN